MTRTLVNRLQYYFDIDHANAKYCNRKSTQLTLLYNINCREQSHFNCKESTDISCDIIFIAVDVIILCCERNRPNFNQPVIANIGQDLHTPEIHYGQNSSHRDSWWQSWHQRASSNTMPRCSLHTNTSWIKKAFTLEAYMPSGRENASKVCFRARVRGINSLYSGNGF